MSAVVEAASTSGVILVPKNRGLVAQAARVLAQRVSNEASLAHVRGEDVGALANEAARGGRTVFAITGDDLLDEWLAQGNELDARLRRTQVLWSDAQAIYGAPALCSIAPSPEVFERDRVRVAVCARYAQLAEPYLAKIEAIGVYVERTYMQGALETVVSAGLADCAIDIVVTGRSVCEAGLRVLDVISRSHIAIVETP